MNDSSCHNVDKDGDQNIDSPCDQLDCNVGISHVDVELEHGKLNLLEGIQHFGTGLVWNNLEYERKIVFHIQVMFYDYCS
jgi:hypothetical protein